MQSKSIKFTLGIPAALLCIPIIAMQFTSEVNWSFMDFVVMGALLFGAGIVIEKILNSSTEGRKKTRFILAVVITLVLIWAEMAVGLFGSPFAGS